MQVETGAVATTPISGTRSVEEVGIPQTPFVTTAGTIVVTVEGAPNNLPIFAAFGNQFINQASSTTLSTNPTTTLTATCGGAANGHTVDGLTWDGTGRGLDCNGGTIATDANQTGIIASSQIYFGGKGSGGGDSSLNFPAQMFTHYPGRLTGATSPTFQQATTP